MSEAQVVPFRFNTNEVRTVTIGESVWFVCTDVAEALGYATAKDAARHLDADEKGRQIVPTPGGDQSLTVINESGLYALVLRSRKPEARKFAKWVTAEVLPAIRKTGAYAAKVGAGKTALATPKDKLTPKLREHINREAQKVSLQQYDNARRILTDCALDNIACGATEANAMQYVEALASYCDEMTLVNVRDLHEMVWNATSAINAVGAACAAIQRLEQRTGLELYHRPTKDRRDDPDFHKHDSVVHEVVSRIAGTERP